MAAWVEDYASWPEVRAQKPVETTLPCPACRPCEACSGQRSITRTVVPLSAKEYTLVEKEWKASFFKMDWFEAARQIPGYKNPVDIYIVLILMAFFLVTVPIGPTPLTEAQLLIPVALLVLVAIAIPGFRWASKKRDKMVESIRQEVQEVAQKRYESLLQQIDPSLTPDKVTFDWDDKDPSKVVLYHQDEGVE